MLKEVLKPFSGALKVKGIPQFWIDHLLLYFLPHWNAFIDYIRASLVTSLFAFCFINIDVRSQKTSCYLEIDFKR